MVVIMRFTQQLENEEEDGARGVLRCWGEMREGGFAFNCWMEARGRLGRNCRISAVGRKVWMLFKHRQKEMSVPDLHPNL